MTEFHEPDIIDLPDEALPAIEELPGDLRLLAEIVGVRMALVVAQRIGGTHLRVPSLKPWVRRIRDRWMRRTYDQGGITVVELARRVRLGERQTYVILGQAEPDERQRSLW